MRELIEATMFTPLVRIILACHLALLSPAVCCCAIKSLAGRVTGVSVGSCGESRAAVLPDDEELGSCCAAVALRASGDEQGDAAGDHHAADAPPPCRCHESDTEARLDTGVKITLPSVTMSPLAMAAAPLHVPAAGRRPSILARWIVREHGPPLRLTTLLSHRTLLLT